MKRLALLVVAAASLAGTGCGSGPCGRSVTVDWSRGFLGSDNQLRGCADARVDHVDLYINGDPHTVAHVPCGSLGAQAVDLPGGTTFVTVEGIESSGRIAYRAEPPVNPVCGDVHVAATPAEGELVLDYSFQAAPFTCYAAQPTYIWSEVWDDVANAAAFVDASTRGASPACSVTAAAPTYRLPVGSYTLLGVNEWSPTAGIVGADCSHPTFTIAAAAQTTVKPVMIDTQPGSGACF